MIISVSKEVKESMFFRLIEQKALVSFWALEPEDLIIAVLNTNTNESSDLVLRIFGRLMFDLEHVVSDFRNMQKYAESIDIERYKKSSRLWSTGLLENIGSMFFILSILPTKPDSFSYDTFKEQLVYLQSIGVLND